MKQETEKPLDPSAARIVAYLDSLYPSGHLRQAKVNALPCALQGGYSPQLGSSYTCLLADAYAVNF